MTYKELFRFLKKWRQFKKFPPRSGWPKEISLDAKAWEGIKKLNYLTNIDNHEYETSFFFIEGDTIITTPLRGTHLSVVANHSLQVKYHVPPKQRFYQRSVLLDGVLVSKDKIEPHKLPRETEMGFLFNVHSHPIHVNSLGEKTYSFFSDTDLRTLIESEAIISGLVTDSFWLVCKTDQVISRIGEVGEELLRAISDKAFAGEEYLDETIRENMQRWGLVFYHGHFGETLVRVN